MTGYDYLARTFNTDGFHATMTTYGSVVGVNPLDTHDGDSSYVECTASNQGVTWRPSPAGSPAPDPSAWVRMRVQVWWRATVGTPYPYLYLKNAEYTGATVIPLAEYAADLGDGWTLSDLDVDLTPYQNGSFALSNAWYIFRASTSSGRSVRATRFLLTIYTDAAKPVRLVNRGDALGMGSGRVVNVGTRQGSVRIFGPH